jgi:hypothetical protein
LKYKASGALVSEGRASQTKPSGAWESGGRAHERKPSEDPVVGVEGPKRKVEKSERQ